MEEKGKELLAHLTHIHMYMYTLAAFLRLFLLFSLPLPPCCCFEGSVVRGFAVGNGALLPSPLSLSLSREESSSFYELAAISGTNDSSWVEIYSYRYRIGVTRGVTSITSRGTPRETFDSRCREVRPSPSPPLRPSPRQLTNFCVIARCRHARSYFSFPAEQLR